jgi:hypothetical protein
MKPFVLAEIMNYNGNRELSQGNGRLWRLFNSIPRSLISNPHVRWRLVDCESTDGSEKLLYSFPAHESGRVKRVDGRTQWEITTRTNAHYLTRTLATAQEPYLWRIENDSIFLPSDFVQSGEFLWRAIELLEHDSGIALVHLRRWTPVDRADLPGSAANNARSDMSLPLLGAKGYRIAQIPKPWIWLDVTNDLPYSFRPDTKAGYGYCPLWEPQRPTKGSVRREGGRWLRLMEEKFASYTNHGWIGKTESLRAIFARANPGTEEEIAAAVRQHARSARLGHDAFLAAGWRTRLKWSEQLLDAALKWANRHPVGTAVDAGGRESVDSISEIVASRQAFFRQTAI